jgi:hypothetical protein
MNTLWSYCWPLLAEGAVIGIVTGLFALHRRPKRYAKLGIGAAFAIGLAALWHGPLGAAQRFSSQVERDARATLVHYEMNQITAHLHHGPLTRHLILGGPADDFQRTELVRTMDTLPGVSGTSWSASDSGPPLIVEAAGVAILGFLFGLFLAYLVELHRRYNAQWNW